MVLIPKKLKRLVRRKRQGFKKKPFIKGKPSKEKEKEKEQHVCYECKKPDYFKVDYPLFKKSFQRFKMKVIIATWCNSEDSSTNKSLKKLPPCIL